MPEWWEKILEMLGGRYLQEEAKAKEEEKEVEVDGSGMDRHRIGGWLLQLWPRAKPLRLYIV